MQAMRHKDCRQRGALFVEAALVIPFFIYLIVNLIYFAMLMHDYMDINNLTRNAVRYASVEASGEDSATKVERIQGYFTRENAEDRLLLYKLHTSSITTAPPADVAAPGTYLYNSSDNENVIVFMAAGRKEEYLPLLVEAIIPDVLKSSLTMKLER